MSELTGPQTLFAALPGCGLTTDIPVAALVRSVLCILLAALLPGQPGNQYEYATGFRVLGEGGVLD